VSNTRHLIRLSDGGRMYPTSGREQRLFDKLAQSSNYMWSDDQMEVSVAEAVKILEAERQALIQEREQLERDKQAFEQLKQIQ